MRNPGLLFLYLSFRFIVFLGRPAIRYSRLLWIPACAGMTVNILDKRVTTPLEDFFNNPDEVGIAQQKSPGKPQHVRRAGTGGATAA